MNLPIAKSEFIDDVYVCIKATYYKCGVGDIIVRTDGLTRGGVMVIYELPD